MRFASLFAGVGGFDLGFQRAGMTPVWHSEIDDAASRVLRHWWPEVPNLGDITQIDYSTVEPVDVVVGGFPCQPFSVAGSRQGADDERWLFDEVVRCLAALRPRWFVLENVPGLLSGESEFDEPIDRCVCGWPVGRGGLYRDSDGTPRDGVLGHGRRWDGGEGVAAAASTAPSVRRVADADARGDGSVGCGVGVAAVGFRHGADVGGSDPVPDHQAGTGSVGVAVGADPQRGGGAERADTMDGGTTHARRDHPRASDGVEPQRAAGSDPAGMDCPSCGQRVGDTPGRLVLRPWMGVVLGALADLGFDISWRVMDSLNFGVPQRRRRVFIVGHLGTGTRSRQVLLEPEGRPWRPPARTEAGTRTAATLTAGTSSGSGVNPPGRRQEDDVNLVAAHGAVAALSASGVGTCGADDNQAQAGHLIPSHAKYLTASNERIDYDTETFVASALTASAGHSSPRGDGSDNIVPVAFTENQRGEETEHSQALTIAGGKPGQDYPAARVGACVRRLTPTECERLQGFPDGWTLPAGSERAWAVAGVGVRLTRARLPAPASTTAAVTAASATP